MRTILAELEGRVAQPSQDQPVGGAGSNSAWGWLTWCQVANNTSGFVAVEEKNTGLKGEKPD